MQERIAVVGLGYVGLPVALAFARKFPGVVGFDIDSGKISELARGFDRNHEQPAEVLAASTLKLTSDIRNSKVVDVVRELQSFGIRPIVHDPLANPADAAHEYAIKLAPLEEMQELDALVLAVSHAWYLERGASRLFAMVREGGVFVDVKSALDPRGVRERVRYWSL
jgi:UDP-N-acetyl-D-mannosaminuronate dehydrogenase